MSSQIKAIAYEQVDGVIDTFCEAFYHYPVMRYVIGADVKDFDSQLSLLIRLFVMGRVLSNDLLFGIGDIERPDAAATVSLPENSGTPEALIAYRNATWPRFDPAARSRYDSFGEACSQFDVLEPHHHLNMIGARNSQQGKGLGRLLVDHVISLSDSDANSNGVSLSTESEANVPFYQKFGFEITGYAEVGPGLNTWNFFRRKD